MKAELYQWVKNLAVFYILLSAAVHLVPNGNYEKYVRFFMGLLLIFMMSTPVFALFGKREHLAENFRIYFARENRMREQEEFAHLQEIYLEKGYERELEKKIRASLQKRDIVPRAIKVHIEGDEMTAEIFLEKAPNEGEERGIEDGLLEECELQRGDYEIKISEPKRGAVDGFSAFGASAGSGSVAGVP